MVAKTDLKVLTEYFNEGDGKRPLADWAKEVRALSPDEKTTLAQGVREITGDTAI